MLLVFFAIIPSVIPWNVLFVNVFVGGSHQTISGYTANLLATNGHSVTYISTNMPKYLHPDITKITLLENERIGNKILKEHVTDDRNASFWTLITKVPRLLMMCGPFFNDPLVQEFISTSPKFDASISVGAMFVDYDCGLAHKLNISTKIVHFPLPLLFPNYIDNLGLPIYKSSVNLRHLTFGSGELVKSSLWLRVKNILTATGLSIILELAMKFLIEPDIYPHVPDFPGHKVVERDISLVLMHHHPLTDHPIPFGPGVVSLAGTLCRDYNPNDMSVELIEFINSADEFIYIAFGSHTKHLLDVEKEILIAAFAKLPFNVVWQMKGTEVPNLPPNVKTFSWLPQMSLLRHPKIKLFITHGGYASKTEAFCGGVPMLVMPMIAFDQYQAGEEITERGLGDAVMSLRDVSSEQVHEKIMKVTTPEILAKSKAMQRQLLATRTTDEQLLGYIDIAISGHSMLPGYQPFWEYFYLDIIFIPIAVIYLIKFVIRKIRG